MPFKTIKDLPLTHQKILMRVDFNVPLSKDGTISDPSRIEGTIPTIQYLLEQNCSLILMSHLGKYEREKDLKYSLKPCAEYLAKALKKPVQFAPDCIGPETESTAKALQPGEILLLENLRFHPEETKPLPPYNFAKQLAALGDIYVNDAFGTSHRKHSSTYFVPSFFPGKSLAGLLVEKEVHFLSQCLHPKLPFNAIIGGAKISTKIGVIESLLDQITALYIGGAMAFTFLKAEGKNVGSSLVEEDELEVAKAIIIKAEKKGIPLFFPSDILYVDQIDHPSVKKIYTISETPPSSYIGVDVGPATLQDWKPSLSLSKTIFWNGPLGIFEHSDYAKGTLKLAQILSQVSALKIIGGGDSVAAIHNLRMEKAFDHLSTGGGASLEYLEKGSLPGIDILTQLLKM